MSELTLGLRIKVNDDGSVQVINRVGGAIDNVASSARRANDPVSTLTTGIGLLHKAMAAGSVVVLANELLDVNKEFQSLRASLSTTVGGLENAGTAFSFVQDFAAKTPFDVAQVTESFIRLGNLGLKPSEEALRSYGNTAAAQSKPIMQMIEAVADATTGEFERLKEFGIKASAHGDKVSFTFQGVTTTIGNSAAEIERYLIDLGNNKFGDAMADQAKTINGAISNLGDSWDAFMDNLLNDTKENLIAKWIADAGAAIKWLDIGINGAVRNADKLAVIDQRITANRASILAHQDNGMIGGLIDDLAGFDVNLKKNQIDADLKARAALTKAIADQKAAQDGLIDSMGKSNAAGASSAATQSSVLASDVELLKAKGQLREAYALEAKEIKHLSEADQKRYVDNQLAMDALKEKNKAAHEVTSAAASAAKSLQTAYDNASQALEKEIALRGNSTKAAAMEYEVTVGALSRLSEAQKLKLLQDAAELDNQALLKKASDSQKTTLDALDDKYRQLTLSARDYFIEKTKIDNPGITPEQLTSAISKFDRNTGAAAAKKQIDDARSSLENYNKTVADTSAKTSDLGAVTSAVFDGALGGVNTLAGAFDNMINSIDKSTAALDANRAAKINIDKFQPSLDRDQYLKDLKIKYDALDKNAKDELKYNSEIVSAKLSGARQIAGAVSSMLKQGSVEQKAAHAIEMGLAGAQIAMQFMKITGIGLETAANVQSVVPYVGATMTKAEADATAGVASQAKAGPWIGFALMAAMAAAMAGLGLMSGKSSVASIGPQGMAPDTGTVLGDPAAKSESIDKTYQLLKDIHADEYATLKSIDRGIADLHSGITDVITRLFQAGGLTAVNAPASTYKPGMGIIGSSTQTALQFANLPTSFLGMKIDPVSNFLMNGIFGGKQTSTVIAQGIATNPTTMTDILADKNLSAQQFAQIQTKTSGGWFGKDKFSVSTKYSALDSATQKALNDVFKNMGSTMVGLADHLGFGLSDRVKNYVIPALTVDLKGLDGEAAAKKLNGVLSAQLDTMSSSIFGDIVGKYQQLGEGIFETTVRIVSEIGIVKDALSTASVTLSGDIIKVSDDIAKASGGIKEFQKSFESFYDKFFTESEKQTRAGEKALAQTAGLFTDSQISTLLRSRDEYRSLIAALDQTNPKYAEQYALLIKLSDSADKYYKSIEAGAKSAVDTAYAVLEKSVSDEKAKLTAKYNDDIKTSQKAIDDFSASITKMSTLANRLKDIVNKTIIPGNESADRTAAQAVISAAIASAEAGKGFGNEDALNRALDIVAKPSEKLFGNFLDYQRDFALTTNDIAHLSDLASRDLSRSTSQLDVMKSQLDLTKRTYDEEIKRFDKIVSDAKAQVDAINGTTLAVTSVAGAIGGLNDAILKMASVFSKEGSFVPGIYSSAGGAKVQIMSEQGAALNDPSNIVTGKTGITKTVGEIQSWVSDQISNDNTKAVYDAAVANGISAASLDAIMGATEGTANAWAAANNLPKFAAGGDHLGGLRIVGENGPELEATGPARIFNANQTRDLLSGGGNAELVAELRALRAAFDRQQEIIEKQQEALNKIANSSQNTESHTRDTAGVLGKVTNGGSSIMTKAGA